MLVLKISQKNIISQAVKILKAGGLIIYPTETCYGAGVDATNPAAVNKILAYKTFRQGKPMSVAVTNPAMAAKYVKLNPTAKNLYQKFLPGPLTVISKSRHKVVKQVESSTGTLGIRIPDYPFVLKLITKFNRPITATSANVSYKKRPYAVKDILNNSYRKQQSLIDLIIDAGTLPKRPASTVVDTTFDDPLILRQGKLLQRSVLCNKITTKSPQETSQLAQTLMLKNWNNLQTRPLIFLLIGELGSGKTQFSKGIGKFLNIKANITSPTYTIAKEYEYNRHHIKAKFIHLDTWRLQNIKEFDQLNLFSYLKPKNILAIEWADRTLKPMLELAKKAQAKIITVKISAGSSPSQRRIFVGR
ncbi:threonylcarbamoyl-AMP synthase [Microgenomates group bacterium]|nr:threonylcarbamoyl-AMP synthase [Microgenomates group bacterium]